MDQEGNETFDTSGALDKLRKSLQLERLALYHDSDSTPWKLDRKWEDLTPKEWTEIFQEGINEHSPNGATTQTFSRRYLLSPINGVLKYHRLGKQERHDPDIPFEKASLVLSDVSVTVSESQYYDGIKLLETFSRYKTRVDTSHLRPVVSILQDPLAWWRFAMLAVLQQRKLCYWFSWDKIRHHCQLRRRYVQLYVNILQQSSNVDILEVRQIERILDSKVILLWRLLAHAKFGYAKSKEASEQRENLKKSWWSFRWRASGVPPEASKANETQLVEEEKLTKEEWQAINEMLSYQPDEDSNAHLGKDNMMQYLIEVSVGKASARIVNIYETEIICGRFEQLHVTTKLYPKSIHCNVTLKSCGLSSPEGSLAESVVSEWKVNALDASFIHAPVGEDLAWRLTATIAPCHVTILMESYEQLLDFVKRSNAVSPTVAMETATALQMKLEQVTRRAQEQIQMVLEERNRFALDIDIDAPKVRVPLKPSESIVNGSIFLLDFGHFMLHTKDVLHDERQSLYSRFYISGRDMSASFVDKFSGDNGDNIMNDLSKIRLPPTSDYTDQFYYILDRCGMSVVVDQIKVPHPRYPSTRVSVQVPNLLVHFSPERYFRIMELLGILHGSSKIIEQNLGGHLQSGDKPWHPVDLATNARTLVWRGLGNSLAEWHPCYLVLSGVYLYVLESEASEDYQRCFGMAGRQVLEVPPASVDGSANAISISYRGVDIQKALESTHTLIIEFHDDESKSTWLKKLVQATYRASAPPSMDIFGESGNTSTQYSEEILGNLGSSDLVINGTLIETKLSIYGKLDRKSKHAEKPIIEIIASGGKVNFSRSETDLTVKMKLHSLKVKDKLRGHLLNFSEYLACSVLSDELKDGKSGILDANEKGFEPFPMEDDNFDDALSDFLSTLDQSPSTPVFLGSNIEPSLDGREAFGYNHDDASEHEKDLVNEKFSEIFYEAQDSTMSDFVVITFSSRNPDSSLYDGIDTQMSIRMSALEFFCNRPTLVALIEFGFDLSLTNSVEIPQNNTHSATASPRYAEKEEGCRTLVKGLLGHGKGRVIFNLKMDVDSVCMFLNMEDGSQLAMFMQESFLLDLKVHPSCISIDGMVGNMKLRDMTLGPDSRWGWLCDIRHPGTESLIKFTFNSYSIEDDDYQGYDYSLTGRLSAVRIVFLYRFVQEITSYFMELASPHTEEAIRFVDKVGGFEWLIQKYEIDGATAVKLDLSLDTPTIIVPKNSLSTDYMQLDLGQLQIKNSFAWHGCKESDPAAIHLDILHAVINGINMEVGVDGILGKPLIREGHGIHIEVRRSLRDVFRKVPTLSIKVKIGLLHGVMSDKEYAVIINCIYMNLSEEPKLPPSFRGHQTGMESIRMIADKVNLNSQLLLSRTVFILAVDVHHALLELLNGLEEGSPLARIAFDGLWVSYRTTSFSEADLYVTIPKFSVLDIRPDTKPEMRLMLGSHTNIYKPSYTGTDLIFPRDDSYVNNSDNGIGSNASYLTMLILDYRWRPSFQSAVIRIQQPRVLVVIDFLLAVAEFFIPSLGSITGREETMNPKNDPLINSDNIILSESVYLQKDQVVHLSPRRQLIVDGCASNEFIYDGQGGTLYLNEDFYIKGQTYTGPILIIGRGKRLRFRNVKIENGTLLRKCTHLSNDSSYSVSADDGVEISLLDNLTSGVDQLGSSQIQEGQQTSDLSSDLISSSSQMLNVTFEAQIVSPEFTFYYSSKLHSNDSLHIEKLVRVKMDLSFMYASKENDTWARSLVKDLTIESGSGLLVLAPVNISAGYTSVKEKTNISITSTDICIHLSLSVASLLLKLQNEALSALQFGNINPLASCSNFKRIWVSPKGNLPGYKLTFWRPRAPTNYAILGDCVTSRPIPPSQVVLAVSNTYGRVRKPVGFKFIASLSSILDLGSATQLNKDTDCSIWMPIPPSGYLAVGCVAHPGNQPPPNHIVYCLRADLVTSTKFSSCISLSPPSSRVPSAFSLWRIDNVVGSFYAHNSVDCPPWTESFDLHQILLRKPDDIYSKEIADKEPQYQQDGNSSSNSSGWDILRTLSGATAYCMSTPRFERIWWDKGCDMRRSISIWRPIGRPAFGTLGDCVTEGLEPPALGVIFKCDNPAISARPVQFTKVAHISGKGFDEAFFWYPIPPPGYVSFGCVVTTTDYPPKKDFVCCPRLDLVSQTNVASEPISRSSSSKGTNCWSIWKVENQACTFLARSDHIIPTTRLAFKFSDYAKTKARENVAAELKLGLLSLSVLDNFCGTMTPLLDTTVTNMNLATHGNFQAINAVLICSIASSTFNRQLEAWEPLIEPFDAIFKMETYHTSKNSQSMVGKQIRFSATSALNVNISAANLETLTETIVSWGRQNDVEHKLLRKSEETGENYSNSDDLISSALDDDVQQVVLENKLGCDVFLREFEQNSETTKFLQHNGHVSLFLPTPRFLDKLNVVANSRESRYYVAIQILESEGLAIVDDGNSHDYFCALRLLIDGKVSDQYKLFPQSARTRCVSPLVSEKSKSHARWNELFIFEVPEKGMANLEVEVTNLASKAGKGEVIGSLCIPVSNSASMLKRAASIKMLQQAPEFLKFSSHPLRQKGQLVSDEEDKDCGSLVVSVSYIDQNAEMNFQIGDRTLPDERDVGFLVGLGPNGPWETFSSVLPLSSVVPKMLDKNPVAFEVSMRNSKKHAVLRSLALLVNDTGIKLEVSLCPSLQINRSSNTGNDSSIIYTEEVFENQRYQPISGWGSNSFNAHANDPAHWSTKDYSYSSKDFYEPPLPSGWRWTSPWKIDKSLFVDVDGWAYGTDFQSFKWPPTSSRSSSRSPSDFVRRRRWTRSRQRLPEDNDNRSNVFCVLCPGSSTYLPWSSMTKGKDLCLQIRPCAESSHQSYSWGQMFTLGSKKEYSNIQPQVSKHSTSKSSDFTTQNYVLRLNQLEKKDLLLYCIQNSSTRQYFWLNVGTDASVLHTELNAPVYDWKISINSALRLENKLPSESEYSVWEKTFDGKMIERQNGIIQSGQSAFIYSADVRKPIYLTLFVQGGWVLEKDAILILDLLGSNHASSFWMVQQRTNRRLRVSVEHDLGGTESSPKTIRLFVPYWIQNDSQVPLSYHIVEVEPVDSMDGDSLLVPRAVKSAKFVMRNSSKSLDKRNSSARKNIQILDVIDDINPKFVMLSPQDYISRSGNLPLQARSSGGASARVGISIAVSHSNTYCPGISLLELERKERVDFNAFASDGSYYRLSAQLKMATDRTKVVHILPQTLFINRIGRSICLSQCNSLLEEWIHPTDSPMLFKWDSNARNELLRIRLESYKWSTPFSIENDGMMCVSLKSHEGNNDIIFLRVEVRGGTKSSRFEVVICLDTLTSPYRIENRSMFLPIRVRQIDGSDDSWQSLPPNSAVPFFWQDLGRQRLLEVLVDGTDPLNSAKYNIDEIMESHPILESSGPIKALRVTVHKEGKMLITQISDWMPENDNGEYVDGRLPLNALHPPLIDYKESSSTLENEFHVTFELTELGLSLIDHMPEEVLFLSVQNLLLSYSSGLGSGISRCKLRMDEIQVDNQLPLSPMPVLFRLQRVGEQMDSALKFSMTMQTNNSLDFCVYPYIGMQVPDNSAFLVNIHEPIIWRLHEMFQQVKIDRTSSSSTTAVSVDPVIKIGVLNISEIRFKVSMAMSPSQRPRGVLGFWSSLMTALGNMEHMPVRIAHRYREEVCMRQSTLLSTAVSHIQKDVLSQPLQLLSGVDILGNASSALSNMSKGVAALSMDKKFIQSRQKQDNKGVEDIGDVIREGGGALAKGLFRGVTGILTKPLEGAKSSGVEGFVQGVGKGLIGAATQPVSGVLDLLSKTTEGANAVRMRIASAIMSEEQLLRKRLPRAIGGDNLLRPYDEYKAQGQAILQLAECGTFFGQVDLFKVRGKFALSDAYEDHFLLPKGKILLVTHRRVLLLQQPTNIMAQRKFSPARDPCSVLWDVLLDDLVTMELTHGKKDHQGSLPSRVILYLQTRSVDSNAIRMIKCYRGSEQATDIYSSIQKSLNAYGPHASKEGQRRKVPQPYSPHKSSFTSGVFSEENFQSSGFHDNQVSVPMQTDFGSTLMQAQSEQEHQK